MSYDILVLGGGNAALCATLMAREAGATVRLVEWAPQHFRGGNSRHTRNIRSMHDAPADVLTDTYPEEEYWQDLLKVTGGQTDEKLARMAIRHTAGCRPWMSKHGVRFQPALGGTLHVSRTNAFFLGGGKALMNAYYRSAQALGVEVTYDTEVIDLEMEGGTFRSATVIRNGAEEKIHAKAVVIACGGFESNLEWLREAWGPPADNFIVRGTPYNTGRVLKALIAKGAKSIGDPTQGHCVAIDARSPKFDGGIVTRVDCVSLGIVVNKHGERFYDEGEDFWPKRYAIWGRLVAQQPDQIAYSIIDVKSMGKFMPPVFPPLKAGSLAELAKMLTLDPAALEATVRRFNDAVRPGTFDHTIFDDCVTEGITPPKTHWARKIDTPPFYGYPLRPGITFTYLGVKIDERARMIMADDKPCANVFAAGEIMAGNVLGKGYIAGIGMAIGTAFGRIAGEEAARHVRS
ncbi:Fumarate reductase flavoprotein subunit [Usitatibacter rugosus]|uniref:Fumarate reductase flavoprotein subunit n=1 Tax=Usitatibacter rugosus TaxID=2732067 RepID=A0A6M4GT02_9PROT|nr:FAD-dependent tricarballylate dehydrogenase TcuA [Usitatibacter rugosus]QJR09433.1 Fumarate reductase flavoprotein subunit [Usitatibacter rugosus]